MESERRIWVEAMERFYACKYAYTRVSIDVSSLLNHLFPSHPRLVVCETSSQDGFLQAANFTRFITACRTLGLPGDEICDLHDMHEASERSLGRIARTVISLAELARRPTETDDRTTSSFPVLTSPSSAFSISSGIPIHVRRAQKIGTSSVPPLLPRSRTTDLSRSLDSARMQTAAAHVDIDDLSALQTPTTSTFDLPTTTPRARQSAPRALPMARETTQPVISLSLRPKSPPIPSSPSGSDITRRSRSSTVVVRPALRPRHSTGSKIQVSFADETDLSSPIRTGIALRSGSPGPTNHPAHPKERTPSLMSLSSKFITGHTGSSIPFSVSTIVGDDHTIAVDMHEMEGDEHPVFALREGA